MTSDLHEFINTAYRSRFLVVDTEGDGKDVRDVAGDPVTMGTALTYRDPVTNELRSEYFAFFHIIGENQPEFFDSVKNLISNHPCVIFYNAKHDIQALKLWGVRVGFFYDLMLMIHLINENLISYKLDYTTKHYGLPQKNKSVQMQRIIDLVGWGHIPVDMMREYSANDGIIEYLLFEKIYPEFCAQGYDGDYWREFMEWILTVLRMETCGIKINQDLCKQEIEQGEKRLQEIVNELGGKVPSKRTDLKALLIDELKLPVVRRSKKTSEPSFDKEAMKIYAPMLERRNSPVAKLIVEYRGWQKVVSTNYKPYLRNIGSDGRLRPNYKIHGTKTGRLSCGSDSDGKTEVDSPNLQNIPRASEKEWDGNLKAAFIPEDDYELWEFDFGQLEMRIAAVYANEQKLLEIFRSGKHLFKTMAVDLGWDYNILKTFVYATNYGAQDDKVATILGKAINIASAMRHQFIDAYPKLMAFKTSKKIIAGIQNRLWMKLWSGRRRHFEDAYEAKHLWFNSLIQGGGAEIVKYVAIRVAKKIDWATCEMLLQVHDSLVFEIRKDKVEYWKKIIKETMEDVPPQFKDKCPFTVEAKIWGS